MDEKVTRIGNELTVSDFLNVSMLQNRDIFAPIRDVLAKNGIICKPPGTSNGTPIWKKVVFNFWSDEDVEAAELYNTNHCIAVEILVEKAPEQDSASPTSAVPTLTRDENTSMPTAAPSEHGENTNATTVDICDQLKAHQTLLIDLAQTIKTVVLDKVDTEQPRGGSNVESPTSMPPVNIHTKHPR